MPSYELMFLIRRMSKPDLVSVLKRVGEGVFEHDGVLRKIEFLGYKQLSHKMANKNASGKALQMASYFLYHFDGPPDAGQKLLDRFKLDSDVAKAIITHKQPKLTDHVCTLEEELLPPSFRPSVLKLMKEGVKEKKEYDRGCKEF